MSRAFRSAYVERSDMFMFGNSDFIGVCKSKCVLIGEVFQEGPGHDPIRAREKGLYLLMLRIEGVSRRCILCRGGQSSLTSPSRWPRQSARLEKSRFGLCLCVSTPAAGFKFRV